MSIPPTISRIITVVAVGAGIWAYLRYFEWKNLYYPVRRLEATPKMAGLDYEEVTFISEDGDLLHGWWIPHPKARGSVIHCHGNAGNISGRLWVASDFHQLGLNVFLFDYRGYGQSRGLPTEKGTYRDARAAYEVVRAKYGDVENPPVIVHGQSLGGAVAIQLACDKPVRGLIVESTFSSTVEIGEHLYPWLPVKWFCRYRYDSLSKVGRLTMPKLFAHSRTDDLVPFELGKKLFDAAAEPKIFCELSGGHNETGWESCENYWRELSAFVDRVFPPQ